MKSCVGCGGISQFSSERDYFCRFCVKEPKNIHYVHQHKRPNGDVVAGYWCPHCGEPSKEIHGDCKENTDLVIAVNLANKRKPN